MTRDDIMRMAREAGMEAVIDSSCVTFDFYDLKKFVVLVAAAEREACAKVAETVTPRHTECGNKIAFAIRERGAP